MPDENTQRPVPGEIAGIDQAKTDEWKKSYKTIFVVYHLDVTYVYRLFTYKEFREIKATLAEKYEQTKVPITVEQEMEEILKRCVLYPNGFDKKIETGDLPGGLPSVLYEQIMQASGFAEHYPDIISDTSQ